MGLVLLLFDPSNILFVCILLLYPQSDDDLMIGQKLTQYFVQI